MSRTPEPPDSQTDTAGDLASFLAGDRESGYRFLGRQASNQDWATALTRFADLALTEPIDIELIARRTIRRPAPVVTALLELLQVVATPQAAFIARAVSELRSENVLRERAQSLADQIAADVGPSTHAASSPEQFRQALYSVLALPLGERGTTWHDQDATSQAGLLVALTDEDDRLRQLSKETSYSSGGYLYFLRHSIADLVLLAGISGAMGERAFRVLQLRVDDLDDVAELLTSLPDETRRRYLAWALEPRKDASPARIRFVLRELRNRFPDDAELEALELLAEHDDPAIASDALVTAISLTDVGPSLGRLASRRISELPRDQAVEVATALIARAPAQLAFETITDARIGAVVEAARGNEEALAASFAARIERITGLEQLRGWSSALEELATTADLDDQVFQRIARTVLVAASQESRRVVSASLTTSFLAGERTRRAFWTLVPEMPTELLQDILPQLILHEPEQERIALLTDALRNVDPERRDLVLSASLHSMLDGQLDAAELARALPSELEDAAGRKIADARLESDDAVTALEQELISTESVQSQEVVDAVSPLIENATAAAAGNDALQATYRRILQTLTRREDEDVAVDDTARNPTTAVVAAIERSGVSVHGRSARPQSATIDDSEVARGLLDLDQLAHAASSDPVTRADAQAFLAPTVAALAETGAAERFLRDLFERGALFRTAVQLSPETRSLLLRAAADRGFRPPPTWTEHPALGVWLRSELVRSPLQSSDVGDHRDLETLFRLAQEAAGHRRRLTETLAGQQVRIAEDTARQLQRPFDQVHALVDEYHQVWRGLESIGWRPVALIGSRITSDELNPERHDVVGRPGSAAFVVRRPGIEVHGKVVERAQLEGIE